MCHAYEVRFLKPDGSLSVLLLASYGSDHHAILSTQHWLGAGMPHASISHNGRAVGAMDWQDRADGLKTAL